MCVCVCVCVCVCIYIYIYIYIYIEEACSYPSVAAFGVFRQQIHLLDFFRQATKSQFFFFPPQNFVLCFLVHKVFTFYIEGTLKCKCPNLSPKVYYFPSMLLSCEEGLFLCSCITCI